MIFFQAVRLSFDAIWSNKVRSFLTMLGVIIGVFAVVALVSLGQGATSTVTEQVQGMGSNLITINITGRGPQRFLTLEQAGAFKDRTGVQAVAPVISSQAIIKHGNRSTRAAVEGTTPEYQEVRNHPTEFGRFIVPTDMMYRQKVVVLGSEVVRELFPAGNPLGQEIRVQGDIFTVVGVLEEIGSGMGGSNDNKVIIPASSAQRLFHIAGVQTVYVQAEGPQTVDRAVAALEATLQYHFRDDRAYRVFNQAQILDIVGQVTGTLTLMLAGIAGISLLVGGIGIMNIMLVSVTERTREIGICKALGAKRRDILAQFLVESAFISSIGGLIGMGLGYGLVKLISSLTILTMVFSLQVVAMALLFSFFVGVTFGLYPANKAAKLHPIDALRSE